MTFKQWKQISFQEGGREPSLYPLNPLLITKVPFCVDLLGNPVVFPPSMHCIASTLRWISHWLHVSMFTLRCQIVMKTWHHHSRVHLLKPCTKQTRQIPVKQAHCTKLAICLKRSKLKGLCTPSLAHLFSASCTLLSLFNLCNEIDFLSFCKTHNQRKRIFNGQKD